MSNSFVHPTAIVESDSVGTGTSVLAFAHVLAGATIGANCSIGDHCFIEGGAVVGDNVTIKNGNFIWDGVTVEDGAFIGPGVIFTNDRWPRSPRLPEAHARYQDESWLERTCIGRGGSIGAGAMIVPGVTIGEFAVVAVGTVVTRDVAPHALVMGQPGRVRGWVCACGKILGYNPGRGSVMRCSLCERSLRWDGADLLARPRPGRL